MKFHIGFAVIGLFSLVLVDQLTFAQTPEAATVTRVNLSGAAFICTNLTGNCPNAQFDPALGGILNGQGTWAANVSLPQAAIVSKFSLCGQFNEVGSSITATLYRTPLTATSGFAAAEVMATVQSSGATNDTQCFDITTIFGHKIDNVKFQYYVAVVVPDNDGVNFTSVGIEY